MTTPKDRLIAHLIDLIQRPTANFHRKRNNTATGLCDWMDDCADLHGGVTLTRLLIGQENLSDPVKRIDVRIGEKSLTIESRDLAMVWNQMREAVEYRARLAEIRSKEAAENKQAEAMLKAMGIQ